MALGTPPPPPRSPDEASSFDAMLAAADASDERAILRAAAEAVARLLGERGSCVLLDGHARVAVSTHAPTLANWPVDLARYPEIELALRDRAVIMIEDVHTDPRLAGVRTLLPEWLTSVAAVPMSVGTRRLGVLMAQSGARRAPTADELHRAEAIGRMAAHLLDRVRLLPAAAAEATAVPMFIERDISRPMTSAGTQPRPVTRNARRVLVVDDDAALCDMLRTVLENGGYAVKTAENGQVGFEHARDWLPHLILLDVNMPVLDGFATADKLHDDPATADVPVLFLSGSDDLMNRVRGLKLGAADFVCKPCFPPELLARIERTIKQASFQRRVRAQTHVDELTGLGNLRALREQLAVEQSRRDRHHMPIAIVLVDLDGLKRVNDRQGHATGSRIIAAVGETLRGMIRSSDLAVRYGGDEFVVLLPHTNALEGQRFASRLLAKLAEVRVEGLTPAASIGVAALGGDDKGDLELLLQGADSAAYEAKRAGGNRLAIYVASAGGESRPEAKL